MTSKTGFAVHRDRRIACRPGGLRTVRAVAVQRGGGDAPQIHVAARRGRPGPASADRAGPPGVPSPRPAPSRHERDQADRDGRSALRRAASAIAPCAVMAARARFSDSFSNASRCGAVRKS